jgi:hypothetical protein
VGNDAASDAKADAAEAGLGFCATQTGLIFCQDFDEGNGLATGAGLNQWSNLTGSTTGPNPNLSISKAEAVSLPNSLLIALTNTQSANAIETITPAGGVTTADFKFQLFLATLPNAGGFVVDYQFADSGGGPDAFGFRLGVFGNATGGLDHADVEHNDSLTSAGYVVGPNVPMNFQSWNDIEMLATFSAQTDGGFVVAFQLNINGSSAYMKTFPAPFAAAPLVRLHVGLPYVFTNNTTWNVYDDNVTLAVK